MDSGDPFSCKDKNNNEKICQIVICWRNCLIPQNEQSLKSNNEERKTTTNSNTKVQAVFLPNTPLTSARIEKK